MRARQLTMARKLDIEGIFDSEAKALTKARDDAIKIHGTGDIKAAGNEVEDAVRSYFRRSLPSRYYVTHGHLIDAHGSVSPQLDMIVADNETLPSLLTTKDGTEYVPITSVYAVGEIKSTYYKKKRYLEAFRDKLSIIENELERPLVENTCFDGFTGSTLLQHAIIGCSQKYLNNLFAFMLCVDGGDFRFENVVSLLKSADLRTLPSTIVLLGSGIVTYGKLHKDGFGFHKYPHEADEDYDWFFTPVRADEASPPAGKHLGYLYGALVEHLSQSRLEPPPVAKIFKEMRVLRRSELVKASDIAK